MFFLPAQRLQKVVQSHLVSHIRLLNRPHRAAVHRRGPNWQRRRHRSNWTDGIRTHRIADRRCRRLAAPHSGHTYRRLHWTNRARRLAARLKGRNRSHPRLHIAQDVERWKARSVEIEGKHRLAGCWAAPLLCQRFHERSAVEGHGMFREKRYQFF